MFEFIIIFLLYFKIAVTIFRLQCLNCPNVELKFQTTNIRRREKERRYWITLRNSLISAVFAIKLEYFICLHIMERVLKSGGLSDVGGFL